MSPRAAVPRAKRILDLVLALLGGLVLLPVILVIALLVRLFLGKPVLFRQPRPGIGGLPFTLYKFRTMRDASDPDGQPLPDAQRLTGFGRLLRATSMDELPELWNVLRGEMSLVGPRPLLMRYLDRYTPQQFRRHLTLPGITGWAQINGRNNVSWEDKFALDVWYVDNWSLWLDIKILLLTPFKVLRREGINQPGNATAMEFMGNQAKASDEGRPL
ncbi:MAG TPA: sugar transferase [Anaerolineales bacterium]|nr:sugar transferase [Anaerolineales bacterium]HRQ92352.1 sugar transferase [Anaerolineales bacterium]